MGPTFNQLLNEALGIAQARRVDAATTFDAARDLSIAITAIEDALTRYNSACYRIAGTWKRVDPDLL